MTQQHPRRTLRRALPPWRRLLPTWRMTVGGLLGLLLLGIAGFVTLYLLVPVPDANAHAVAQSNVYYWSDGTTELARTGTVNREDIPIERIPPTPSTPWSPPRTAASTATRAST